MQNVGKEPALPLKQNHFYVPFSLLIPSYSCLLLNQHHLGGYDGSKSTTKNKQDTKSKGLNLF